jgi:hypothetical protein
MANACCVRSRVKQYPRQVRTPCGSCLMKRRVSSGLRHIDIRALLDQQAHGLTILAQGNTCMQWLVVHGIPREAVYMRAVGEQQSRRLGSAKRGRQMQRRPTVGRTLMDQHRILSQQRFKAAAIAQSAGLKNIQCGQVGKQKIPDHRLAAVNAPQKSRDALGVSASNQRRILFRSGGDFRRLAVADQVKKALAHRASLASMRDHLTVRIGEGSSQYGLLRSLDHRTRFGAVRIDAEGDYQVNDDRHRLAV